MRCVIALILLLVGSNLSAQREAANWYFGTFAGLDFNSGTPMPLFDGQIRTVEGCEAFSDSDGNLLFYTEGNSVWNRQHEVMPNGTGLGGSFSTTQSALVVPNPVAPNIYYVFTPDDALAYRLGSPTGFNYSVVNMGLEGGLGDVTSKNIDLLPEGSEKVSAVRGPTGDFYWVVTHFRDRFYSYRVDASGVNTNPVISVVGPLVEGTENVRGALKISPNGSKLAVAHTILQPEYDSSLHLYDFDSTTGRVSNEQSLSDDRVYYGVEFSANSSKLYSSGMTILRINGETVQGNLQIVQFDLEQADILGSEYTVHTFEAGIGNEIAGSLQIAIDRKIYHAVPNSNLSVIRTPNLDGINCDFREFAVDLGDRSATYGLPPFIQSFFETIVTIENFCEGETTTFTTESTGDVTAMSWNFGDPASGAANTSTAFNPTHVFSAPGVYTVTLDVDYSGAPSRQFIEFVEIAEVPNVATNVELVQCEIDGIDDGITPFNLNEAIDLFNNGNEDISALFFSNMADAVANENQLDPIGYVNAFDGERIYARAFENAECFTIVEIVLRVNALSDLGTYGTFDICAEEPLSIAVILDTTEAFDFLSNEFPSDESISIYASKDDALFELNELPLEEKTFGPRDELAYYFRIENNFACDYIGRLAINIIPLPEFDPEVSAELCNNEAQLFAPEGFDSYSWSTGESTAAITVNATGTYQVTFSNATCTYVQQIVVGTSQVNNISSIEVVDFRASNEIIVHMENPDDNVLFSIDGGTTFQAANTFNGLLPGIYEVVVDNGCTLLEEIAVVGGLYTFFTPNNDGVNDRWELLNPEFFPNVTISVFDRYGKLLNSFQGTQSGWDGTFRNREMPSDDYWYRLEMEEGRVVTGHFALKR